MRWISRGTCSIVVILTLYKMSLWVYKLHSNKVDFVQANEDKSSLSLSQTLYF